MSTLEKTIEQIKSEGFSSNDVQKAISKMREKPTNESSETGNLEKHRYSDWDDR